jgi:hypothetical protein
VDSVGVRPYHVHHWAGWARGPSRVIARWDALPGSQRRAHATRRVSSGSSEKGCTKAQEPGRRNGGGNIVCVIVAGLLLPDGHSHIITVGLISAQRAREFTLRSETSPAYVRYDSDLLLLSDFDVDGRSLTLSRLTAKH